VDRFGPETVVDKIRFWVLGDLGRKIKNEGELQEELKNSISRS